MRAVVTGGCGFIGSHLVDLLLAQGHQVDVVDSLVTGRLNNLAGVKDHPLLKVHRLDVVTQSNDVAAVLSGADQVFHLAALADIVPSIERPRDYFDANVQGTLNVMEGCRAGKVGRLLYVASSSCYGIPDAYPTAETAPIRPMYPYALTKLMGEQLVLHWGQTYQLNVVTARLFNVFGPRARTSGAYGAVLGVFLAQKLAGKPLTIVGDGTQSRDFTYVEDVARALWALAQSNRRNEAFNVATGKHTSVNRMAELVGGPRVSVPKRPGEPDRTHADISKLVEATGWQPQVSFEEGMARTMAHLQDWKDAPVWTPESIEQATRGWMRALSK